MAEIFLITGGCRSGKSGFAEKLAHKLSDQYFQQNSTVNECVYTKKENIKAYIATAPVFDEEMSDRVKKHQIQRAEHFWTTFEEQIDLKKVLKQCYKNNFKIVLVDCLTLWINNLIYNSEQNHKLMTESEIFNLCEEIIVECKSMSDDVKIIFVINEVGLGIVPENKLARLFRDLSGRCSQTIAKKADNVFLISCGLPLQLKGNYDATFTEDN